ncbi:MAG TPA: hypothetical protein VIP46_10080 [Pyrinomonadaceae bacterium]
MPEETTPPEVSPPTIFLIEEDDHVRPLLKGSLRQRGYRVLVAADFEDALEWVRADGHLSPDLVLINLVGKTPEETLRAGRVLRQHAKYDGHTPLVVIPEDVPAEYEGTDDNVSGNEWVCYYGEESEQLQALISRLLNRPPS